MRVPQATVLFAVLGALAACRFQGEVPLGAQVACGEGGVCPQGTFCQARLDRCLPTTSEDRDAPRLLSATLSARHLRRGAPLAVEVTASEPLAAPPEVLLQQGGATVRLALRDGSGDAPYQLDWAGADPLQEGAALVLVTLVDLAGNESANLPAGAVELDFTAPAVTELRVLSPRDADGGVVTARPDEPMTARVTATEPVQDQVTLTQRTAGCADAPASWALQANRDGVLDFRREGLVPTAADCTWTLELSGLVDLAGNVAPAALVGPSLRLLGEAPGLDAVALFRAGPDGGLVPTRTFSRQPGYSRLEARFTVEASAERLVATFDDQPVAACDLGACAAPADGGRACACARDVGSADLEGPHVFAVQVSDGAGNQRTAATPLRFDFTPPALVPGTTQVLLTPRPGCPLATVRDLGPGGTARVTFTLDEPVAAAPRVALGPPANLALGYESGAGTGFSFAHVLASEVGSGTAPVEVAVVDEAGNPATLGGVDAGLLVRLDLAAPAALPVTTADAVRFTRAPWGDSSGRPRFTVSGATGSAEPGTVVRVLAGADTSAGLELGAGVADADGGFSVALGNIDREETWVHAVDLACNEGPALRVRDIAWIASLGGKLPGAAFPNPHALEAWGDFAGEAQRRDADDTLPVGGASAHDGQLLAIEARSTWSALDGTAPSARCCTTMAWDRARGRAVFFGGYLSSTFPRIDDTWEFGPSAWAPVTPATGAPPARNGQATSYDVRRRRVVMSGGYGAAGRLADTWEWDGAAWTLTAPLGPAPAPRDSHAMAWDGVSGRLLLFGGLVDGPTGGVPSDETWAWDGTSWTRLAQSGPAPSARYNHALAWDAARQRVLLFGGVTAAGNDNELWAWDGAAWARLTPLGTPPSPRNAHALAFDARRQVTVLFGGQLNAGLSAETWEYDGVRWGLASPLQSPAARRAADMVYDEERGVMLLFGGFRPAVNNETWEYDGVTWRQRGAPGTRPPARYGAASAWDPLRQQVVLFGGTTGTTPATSIDFGDTWTWNGVAWAAHADGGVAPPPRGLSAMAWDPGAEVVVLTGGSRTDAGARLGDTWEWTGAGWRDGGTAGPSPRYGHVMATDVDRGGPVLFGGWGGASYLDDTWVRQGGAWVPLYAGVPPAARYAGNLAWDPLRRALVLFGGMSLGASLRDDTWLLGPSGWSEHPSSGPSPRNLGSLAWDDGQQRLVLHGGGDSQTVLSDTWEWNGTGWAQRKPGPRSPPLSLGATMTWDAARRQLVRFGGRTYGNLDNAETWAFGLSPTGRAAAAARFQLARAGKLAATDLRAVTARWVAGGSTSSAPGPAAGVDLWAWDGSTLSPVATGTAPAAAPALVEWTTRDPARLRALLRPGGEQELLFVLATTGPNGATGRSRLAVDYLEVEVRYQRP